MSRTPVDGLDDRIARLVAKGGTDASSSPSRGCVALWH